MPIFELPGDVRCPRCSRPLNMTRTTQEGVEGPKANDLTICEYCLVYLEYVQVGDKLSLELLSDEKFESLPERHQIPLMQLRGALAARRQSMGNQEN